MLHKVKLWLQSHNLIESEGPLRPKMANIDHQQHKKEVMSKFQLSSMVKHEADCDIFSCKGGCFIQVPDKIIGKEYKVDKKTRKRVKSSKS